MNQAQPGVKDSPLMRTLRDPSKVYRPAENGKEEGSPEVFMRDNGKCK